MSAIKKKKAILLTAAACGEISEDGEFTPDHIHAEAEPVMVEFLDEGAGEVVYDAGEASGKSRVGYSRLYASRWDEVFADGNEETLPN